MTVPDKVNCKMKWEVLRDSLEFEMEVSDEDACTGSRVDPEILHKSLYENDLCFNDDIVFYILSSSMQHTGQYLLYDGCKYIVSVGIA